MSLFKGIKITNLRAFVIERFGDAAWRDLLAVSPTADREQLANADAASWYESELSARITRALSDRLGGGGFSLMQELGRFEADRELPTVHRWSLQLMPPSVAIQNMTVYWRRAQDIGQWRSDIRGNEVVAELSDWDVFEPACCYRILGYLGRCLELLGGEVEVLEHPTCRARGSASCVFRAELRLPGETPFGGRAAKTCSREDIARLSRALADFPDLESTADAIVLLFHEYLACSRVALWIARGDAMQLVRGRGEPGQGAPHRFVLEARGRTAGWLDVEMPAAGPRADRMEIVDEILPWIAAALASNAWSERAAAPEPPAAAPPARTGTQWGLTLRQVEVLELVARGKTNKEIAGALGCQEGTVELHVTHIFRKCGVENRATLAAMYWSDARGDPPAAARSRRSPPPEAPARRDRRRC